MAEPEKSRTLTFGSGINELSGVHALDGDEILSTLLVFVLVAENNLSKGSTSTRVVNNVLNKSLNVSRQQNVALVNTLKLEFK